MPRWIVLAFWGIESDFGASGGSVPTIRALATLAEAQFRGALFRDELLAALTILERGDVAPERMKGSWAGAMGQVQFLPSSFLAHAVDFDGDGRRDIWSSEADALASIAAYLKALGWNPSLSWGYEVHLPRRVRPRPLHAATSRDFARARRPACRRRSPAGRGPGSLFLPGGLGGPAFLITDNFEVIRAYNTSDSYALAVGHLADRLAGGPALAAPWPMRRLPASTRPGCRRSRPASPGAASTRGEADGRAGPKLREAVRQLPDRRGPAGGRLRHAGAAGAPARRRP